MNRFISTDPSRCIGCRTCELACAVAHAGGVGALAAVPFQPRIRVVKTGSTSTALTCRHCEDAPCLHACPSGAIFYAEDSVQVDQARCLGCKSCVVACPFGAIEVVTRPATRSFAGVTLALGARAEAQKCDLCLARAAGPACIEACPTDALSLMDSLAMAEKLRLRRERSAMGEQRPLP